MRVKCAYQVANAFDNASDYLAWMSMASYVGQCYVRSDEETARVIGATISSCVLPDAVTTGWNLFCTALCLHTRYI